MNWLRIWERMLTIQYIFSSKVGWGCYSEIHLIPQVFCIPPTLPLINRFRKLWPVRFGKCCLEDISCSMFHWIMELDWTHLCSSAVCTALVISIIIEPYRYPWGFNHESPRHPTNAHRPDRYPHHTSQSPGSFKISHPRTFFRIAGTWTVEQCLSLSTKTNPSSLSSFISKACRPHCNNVLLPGRPK